MPFKDRFLPFQPVDPDFKLLDFLVVPVPEALDLGDDSLRYYPNRVPQCLSTVARARSE
jgi:hypothetical protein